MATQVADVAERPIPRFIILMGSLYITAALALSYMEGWNVAVKAIAAVYVLMHLLYLVGRRLRVSRPNPAHLLFVLWATIGLTGGYNTINLVTLFGKLWTMIQIIGISYLLYSLAIQKGSIRWIEWSVLAGVMVACLWLFVTTGGRFGEERIAATTGNPNVFAFLLLLNSIVCLDFLRQYRNVLLRLALVGNIFFSLSLLVSTGSRKGVIGFFCLLGIWWFLHATVRERKNRGLSLIIGAMVLTTVLAFYLPRIAASPHFGRLQNLERYIKGERLVEQEVSLDGRTRLARSGMQLAFDNPFFGVGLDCFRYYNRNTLILTPIDHSYSHSNVIEVLADTGFIGFALYHAVYFIIALRLLRLWRKRHLQPSGRHIYLTILLGATIIPYDLFSVTYYTKEYWVALTLVLCSVALAEKQEGHTRFATGAVKSERLTRLATPLAHEALREAKLCD